MNTNYSLLFGDGDDRLQARQPLESLHGLNILSDLALNGVSFNLKASPFYVTDFGTINDAG